MKEYLKGVVFGLAMLVSVFSYNILEVKAVASPEPTPDASNTEVKDSLEDYYNYYMGRDGDVSTVSPLSKRTYNATYSLYDKTGMVFFGNTSSVYPATHQVNNFKGSSPRFFGISSDGRSPVTNFLFPDDIPTDGDVLGRGYTYYPWKREKANQVTNSYKPGNGKYNIVANVEKMEVRQSAYNDIPIDPDKINGSEIMDVWLSNLYDKYKRDHAHWKSSSRYFNRTDTRDQFKLMSKEKLRSINYIAMPPTFYTVGVVNNFYDCSPSASKYCYDVFWSDQLESLTLPDMSVICEKTSLCYMKRDPDLKATKLTASKKNRMFYDIKFTGELSGTSIKKKAVMSYARYRIGGGAWQDIEEPNVAARFGTTWLSGDKQTALMGSIFIPPGTKKDTKVEVEAELNPMSGITSGKRGIDEADVSNNKATITFYTEEMPMCAVGGDGTKRSYSTLQISGSHYDKDTDTTTYSYYCSPNERYLNNLASVNYNDDKQTLMGIWSKNTSSHTNKSDTNALGSVPSREEFNVKLTGPFVEKLNKLGIKNPKRTIRAGRSVQLYGTIELELNLRSFSGSSDLNSRKNAFLKEIEDTIETRGVYIDDGAEGKVKNNEGKTRVRAQFDKTRTMVTNAGSVSSQTFGDSSCITLTEYSQTFKITIPVKTLGNSGTQKTSQSSFIDEKSYSVKDKASDFVTNINTPNGVYALSNSFRMDASKLDGALANTMWCTSNPEDFRVKGNIFDDVRSEDESDKVGKNSGNWDF